MRVDMRVDNAIEWLHMRRRKDGIMKYHFIEYTVERDDDDYDLDIEYTITPYYPATGPSFSGPGEPAEGGEVELCSVMHDGLDFIMTPKEEMEIINWINNNHDPDDGEYGDEW